VGFLCECEWPILRREGLHRASGCRIGAKGRDVFVNRERV
jgi:hypothetical protein